MTVRGATVCVPINYRIDGLLLVRGSSLKLLQIVPRLPPRMDGIGDHAVRLAQQLRKFHNIETSFLVCDPDWKGPAEIDSSAIQTLRQRDAAEFSRAISNSDSNAILLQFAPYGYSIKGCPLWLANGIERSSQEHARTFISMFHELEAGRRKPWNSTFWLSPIQKRLIRRIAACSTFQFTNTAYHQQKLHEWGYDAVKLLPSFSTIGEPVENLPTTERERQIIIFGRPWQRSLSYTEGIEALNAACKLIDAEKIIDIGAPISSESSDNICGLPLVRCGSLPSREISSLMSKSIASFIFYPEALLTKSSIYAASCAHGAIPFVEFKYRGDRSLMKTELEVDKDYFTVRRPESIYNSTNLLKMSTQVYERYQSRNSSSAASKIASSMKSIS